MKFAYSTNAFKRYSLEESLKLIKEIGLAGVEIMADRPHLYPPDYATQSRIKTLKNLLASLGLKVSNLNSFTLDALPWGNMHHPSWIEGNPEHRRIRYEHTKQSLALAAQLGCSHISIQPGGKVEHYSSEESMRLFITGLQEVIPDAQRLGVKLLVEPEPDLLMENSSQFTEFIKQVDTSVIGLNCDVGHFFCAGEDPAAVIRQLSKYIHHVHMEDIKGRVHEHLICGRGEIDFTSIFDALREIGYDGFISLELYPYQDNPVEAGRESLKFLKQYA